MNKTLMVSSVGFAVEILAAPPHAIDAACLRPQYGVGAGLSITLEVLLLLVGLANLLRKLVPADPLAHPGA